MPSVNSVGLLSNCGGESSHHVYYLPLSLSYCANNSEKKWLHQVILADATRCPIELAHNNVIQPDIMVLVRSSDDTAYVDQKAGRGAERQADSRQWS